MPQSNSKSDWEAFLGGEASWGAAKPVGLRTVGRVLLSRVASLAMSGNLMDAGGHLTVH